MNENLSKIHKASFQSIELEDEGVLYLLVKSVFLIHLPFYIFLRSEHMHVYCFCQLCKF